MASIASSGAKLGKAEIHDFLSGGGELGSLMRAYDWAASPLGPPSEWPQSLKMAVRIMLTSRQPIWIGWGRELTYFYNDPYKSIIGGKHPWALGRPTREVWREIWTDIGPMLDTAMGGSQGTYVESQLLIMERHGYPEETYYTFSYSPIPDDDGSVGGIFCANSDDTLRVIGERQLGLLRELAAGTANARSWREACERSAEALSVDPHDIPFALLYVAEPERQTLSLVGSTGIDQRHPAAPETLDLATGAIWPYDDVLRKHEIKLIGDLKAVVSTKLPAGPWHLQPHQAALVPISPSGETGRSGILVAGLNPFRVFDESYRGFLGLVAGQISAAIANAQAYEEERRRAEALAEVDRSKTAFFSNVSHEFRTPLTLMLGPIEDALNDETAEMGEIQRTRLEVAHRNSLRLLRLVNSLLDFSRIEAGRAEAAFEPVDLARLTAELASNFESATEKAGLTLTIETPPLGRPVYVDREMWEKIVLNLLSNAFKFTFEGEIVVRIQEGSSLSAVELIVQDTGVGIPQAELPRLFERFHRVEGQKSRSFEGSGIGLALVQELVKLHGGTIEVESAERKGTTFKITVPYGTNHLPSDKIAAEAANTSRPSRAEAFVEEALRWLPGSGKLDSAVGERTDVPTGLWHDPADNEVHILVADDNSDMRDYVRRLLGKRWSVETVGNGIEALEALRNRKPDLILSDVMMPDLDGFSLLRRVRAEPNLRDIPVILLSARAGEEARIEGLDSGADDYLTKPFSARELIARVNTNLELARVRREVTRELRESEARFRNMADHAPVMMWMTDASGSLTYLNRVWCDFTGQTLDEAIGYGAWDALHAEDRADSERIFFTANAARKAFRIEYRLRNVDGAYRWALSAAAPRFSDDGDFLGYIGSVIDISDRKRAEQVLRQANEDLELRVAAAVADRAQAEAQLRQAQKMEAVGKLTGGVAHDFNNVLQVISGNLQLLSKDVAGNLRAEQRLQTAIAGVSRGSKLAAQLLAFGRRQPLAPKVVNLGRLIREIDDMLRRALGESIQIETIVGGGLWNTLVDTGQFENALLNLAINARDAMEGHGRLTIELGNAFLDDDYADRHVDVCAGQYVLVAVTDTGCGISPDIIDEVFEPFFTTKPEGQGTGLGLSMVYGFVKQSGGHIKIYSEPKQGTTIKIYLPRVRQAEDIETNTESGPPTGGTETILVVEDDEDVRTTVVEMLSELGYRVLKAKDAQSALAIVESGVPIDVLFTDVVMPGELRSPELARKARERLPDIVVLFTSGYTENAIVHGGRLDEGVDLLSKPYTREALARKLRHALRNRLQRNQAKHSAPKPSFERTPHSGSFDGKTAAAWSDDVAPATILLVEDDAMIRLSTADMLEGLGCKVLQAGTAAEALNLLSENDFDVLLTDVGLPEVSGQELASKVKSLRPSIAVIFASGYEALPGADVTGIMVRKPYDERALIEALRAAVVHTGAATG